MSIKNAAGVLIYIQSHHQNSFLELMVLAEIFIRESYMLAGYQLALV
jgi:hypothetical protein